jgi:hypothetical protein
VAFFVVLTGAEPSVMRADLPLAALTLAGIGFGNIVGSALEARITPRGLG